MHELDEPQRRAASLPPGPVCILAGAGTGKTRAVTSRIAHLVGTGQVPAGKVLAVTHSSKAAGELHRRLLELGVQGVKARTFHSAALSQLRSVWPSLGLGHPLALVENRYAMVRQALGGLAAKKDVTNDLVFDVDSEIGWAKSSLVLPGDYVRAARLANRQVVQPVRVAKAYEAYEAIKDRAKRLDFEDLLARTADLFVSGTLDCDAVKMLVVDEYQDTDPLQHRLLSAWLGPNTNVTVVGDKRQCIYSFKGATVKGFDQFRQQFPSASWVSLTNDYRSSPQVVDFANRLLSDPAAPLVGRNAPGPAPTVTSFDNEAAEERFVVSRIRALLAKGTDPSEIAVLYRFNSQAARIESALGAAGIPYLVTGDQRFFERPEVRSILSSLWSEMKTDSERIGADVLYEVLERTGWDRSNPPAGQGQARARWESVNALVELIEAIPGVEVLGLPYLVEDMLERSQQSHDVPTHGVTVATLHRAKGLEWDAVFMVGVTEGSLPSGYATTLDEVDEERRLAYVGITRARRFLSLSWARKNAKNWTNKPSRFLAELERSSPPRVKSPPRPTQPTAVSKGRTMPAKGRLTRERCTLCQSALFEALVPLERCEDCLTPDQQKVVAKARAWRERQAQRQKVTVDKVFSDRALWALVAAMPTRMSDLERIPGIGPGQRREWGAALLAAL